MLGVVLVAAVLAGGVPGFTQPRWLGGNLTGRAPAPLSANQPTLPPLDHSGARTSEAWPLVFMAATALAAAIVLWLVLRAVLRGRVQRASLPPMGAVHDDEAPLPVEADAETEPDAPVLHRGLQLALDALDEEREPADAVVKAWLGLQRAAEDSGVQRRSAETPTEFTSRVITRVRADAGAARQLVDVYQAVRFGAHPITSAEVRTARTAVTKLLDSWHEPVLGRRR